MPKVSEMIKSLKGVIAALAVIIFVSEFFCMSTSVYFIVSCVFLKGKPTEEKRAGALTKMGNALW
jgi:hypothetical protein